MSQILKDRRSSRIGPPPDSDLIGIPLVVGVAVAALIILAAFFFADWTGVIVLVAVLIAALLISWIVVTGSESE